MSLRVYSLFRALSFQGTAAESISPTNGQSQMRLVEFDQCRYRRQLLQLQQQGFLDEEQNVRALLRADGNVLSAVEYLVDDGSVRDDTRGQQDSQLRVSEDSLPFEIWTKIFEYLNPSNDLTFSSHLAALRDYHAVSLTCKGFYAAVMPLMHQTLIANPAAGCGCTATLIRDSLDRPSKKAHRESSDRLKRMSTDLARRYARLVMFNTNKKCIACPYATRLFLQHLASFKRIQQAYIHDVCFTNSTLFLFLKFETLPIPYLHLNACDVAASIQTEDVIRVPVSSLRIDVGWHASAARSPTLASGAAKLVHAFVVEGSLSSLCIDFQACEQTKEIVGALTERKLVLRKLKSLKLTNRFPLSDPYGMRLNPNAAPHLHRWILKDILPFCMSLTRLDLSQMRFDVSFAAPLDPQHLPCLIELSCLYDFLPLVSLCRTLRDLHLRCCTSVDLKRGIGQLLEGHAAALEDVESLRVHVPNMTEQLYTSIALACPKLKWLHFSSTTDYWTWQELPLEGEHREAFPGGRRWMDFRNSLDGLRASHLLPNLQLIEISIKGAVVTDEGNISGCISMTAEYIEQELELPASVRCFKFRFSSFAFAGHSRDGAVEFALDPSTKERLICSDPRCAVRRKRALDGAVLWGEDGVVMSERLDRYGMFDKDAEDAWLKMS